MSAAVSSSLLRRGLEEASMPLDVVINARIARRIRYEAGGRERPPSPLFVPSHSPSEMMKRDREREGERVEGSPRQEEEEGPTFWDTREGRG